MYSYNTLLRTYDVSKNFHCKKSFFQWIWAEFGYWIFISISKKIRWITIWTLMCNGFSHQCFCNLFSLEGKKLISNCCIFSDPQRININTFKNIWALMTCSFLTNVSGHLRRTFRLAPFFLHWNVSIYHFRQHEINSCCIWKKKKYWISRQQFSPN